jgi:hypothetical protein
MAQKNVAGTGRGNWKYDRAKHTPLLMQIFKEGGDIAAFCSSAQIARSTFQEWRANFEDFHKSYDEAKELARAWWEKEGQTNLCNPHFNTNAWRLMMRNRFDMTDSRKVGIPGLDAAKTYKDQYNCVRKSVENEELTPDEALKLGNFIAVGAKIDTMDEVMARLEALEANVGTNQT